MMGRVLRLSMWAAMILLLPLGIVLAQGATQVFINYPEVFEAEDGLQLNLYFTVTDSGGQVVPDASLRSARFVLDDGSSYEAELQQPESPFYIVLVLDASGSMSGAAAAMQQAAIQFVNNAPELARFNIIGFNEQIDVLMESFTRDQNRAMNAIAQVQPVNLKGTCLYDAAYAAIELLSAQPNGRRAVVLFTDGQDEVYQPAGQPCSVHSYGEVVDLANRPDMRVPIHTIGLRGSSSTPINEADLRNLAGSTGGLSAIGGEADLPDLFGRIMTGLASQRLATSLVYPAQGQIGVSLFVTLEDGKLLQPAGTTFVSPQNYLRTPTPAATLESEIEASVTIDALEVDIERRVLIPRIVVEGADLVSEYRFDLKDSGNLLRGTYAIDAPLPATIELPMGDLTSGQYSLIVSALMSDGQTLARSAEERFAYTLPTATPTPTASPTATLTPTATPTSTETPTPTPTAVQVSLGITPLQPDADDENLVIRVDATNTQLITRYELELKNESNMIVASFSFDTPPYDQVSFPLSALGGAGAYTITLRAVGVDEERLTESSVNIRVYPTPTPPPTATATVAPTLTPVPPPPAFASADWLSQNRNILIPVIGVLVVGLVLLLIILMRRPKQQTGTQFLSELTGLQQVADLPPVSQSPMGSFDPDATNLEPHFDPDATNPIPQLLLPHATIQVLRSRDTGMEGRSVVVNHVPFTFGRRDQGDLNFEADDNVSRKHAQIDFKNNAFSITDLSSTHGTLVNGQAIGRGGTAALESGAQIVLGRGTVLLFECDSPAASRFDSDKTAGGTQYP